MDFVEHLKKYLSSNEIDELISSFNDEDEHALLLNTEKISPESFINMYPNVIPHPIVKNGYLYNKDEYPFGKNYMHDAGVYYLQEPSAMIVASLLNPNENDIVLDMCAAPGGKTIQSSLLMKNEGLIIANDLSYTRAKALSSNVERMGRKNIIVTSIDLHKLNNSYKGKFTKIILDAPCSGSGMFRKDPKFIQDWTYEKVLKCSQTQKELIDLAFEFLKEDGILVYSTCSYSYEENEEIIKYALDKYQDLEILPIQDNNYFKSYQNLGIHLFPSYFKGEGHYICLLHKKGNSLSSSLPICKNKIKISKDLLNFLKQYNLDSDNIIDFNNSIFLYFLNHIEFIEGEKLSIAFVHFKLFPCILDNLFSVSAENYKLIDSQLFQLGHSRLRQALDFVRYYIDSKELILFSDIYKSSFFFYLR